MSRYRPFWALVGSAVNDLRGNFLAILAAVGSDLSVFYLCHSFGLSLALGHIISFAASAATIYFLKARPAFARVATNRRKHGFGLIWQFGLAGILVLFLRGGVLSLLAKSWGWVPSMAMIPAAVVGALTMVGALALLIRLWDTTSDPEARWRILGVAIVGYLFALRLIYLGQAELLPEEAYYWNYSQHLDIGYLDHPPMVAWLIWLGTSIFGQNEFGVRIGAFGCWMVTSFFVYRLTRNLFDKSSALVAVLLVQALPYFFSVGFLMTPDAPLVAFWSGALCFAAYALLNERRSAWWGVGVCLGLGMISKYSIGVLGPAMFLFLLLDSRSRRWFLRWEPYAAALIAALIFSPVIIWNFQHGWASFGFQSTRRLSAHADFSLHELIGSILVLLTPTGILAALLLLFRSNAIALVNDVTAKRRAFSFGSSLSCRWRSLWLSVCGIECNSTGRVRSGWRCWLQSHSRFGLHPVLGGCRGYYMPHGCQAFWRLSCSTPQGCITSFLAFLGSDTASRFSWCRSAGGIWVTRLVKLKMRWNNKPTSSRSSSECTGISSPASWPSTIRTGTGQRKLPVRISSAARA